MGKQVRIDGGVAYSTHRQPCGQGRSSLGDIEQITLNIQPATFENRQ